LASHLGRFVFGVIFVDDANDDVAEYVQWKTPEHLAALEPTALLMDRAYEGDETRLLAIGLGYAPVVPPKENRVSPWEYDRAPYKRRNEIERLFRRLKGFRRIFSRFEKLDVMFAGFIHFVRIVEALRLLC
jgi:transposase